MGKYKTRNILIIGVGNNFRSDDSIGPYVARKVKDKNLSEVTTTESTGEGSSLMELWANESFVILIDAVSSSNEPGKIHKINAHKESVPSDYFHYSTHAFSIGEAIELSRTFGNLPKTVIIYGIEGKDFQNGTTLTKKVQEAGDKVIDLIINEIENLKGAKTNNA
ncbi:MAG: hydrogenase maturation protease [Candidatus Melainabacteria bacterium]|nr:hydrogenase maturation protease [Candidatus Melainabacteria bacterium]